MRTIVMRGAAVLLALGGCVLVIDDQIMVAALFWIGAAALWLLSSSEAVTRNMDTQRFIDLPEECTVERLFRDLGEIDTPLGKPWLCKVTAIKHPALVYGPDRFGGYIYGYWFTGEFAILTNEHPELLQPAPEDHWRLDKISASRSGKSGAWHEIAGNAGLLKEYRDFFLAYAENRGRGISQEKANEIFRVVSDREN